MATYTKSTGYEIIIVEGAIGYNSETEVYTCPAGKIAVIQDVVFFHGSSNSSVFGYIYRKYSGAARYTANVGNAGVSTTPLHMFGSSLTYNGSNWQFNSNFATGWNNFYAERILAEGDGFGLRSTMFSYSRNYHLRIELHTPQV